MDDGRLCCGQLVRIAALSLTELTLMLNVNVAAYLWAVPVPVYRCVFVCVCVGIVLPLSVTVCDTSDTASGRRLSMFVLIAAAAPG